MKIRSITCFVPSVHLPMLDVVSELIASARCEFIAAGYEVQTSRLATIPFPYLLPSLDEETVTRFVYQLETDAAERGFGYISIGPALPDFLGSYTLLPSVLRATENVFASGMMLDGESVSMSAVRACADVIYQLAPLSPDGFANLRFCASANVLPGTPFFPAAYHDPRSQQPTFALAIQAADLALEAFMDCPLHSNRELLPSNLQAARQTLINLLETHAGILESVANELALKFKVSFGGIDFSLAPFPSDAESFGAVVEALGVPAIGLHGSLAAAALLADSVDRAHFARVGFSGLMLPVLEDTRLAERAAEGTLTINDLLLYAAVCGTGLDTVPLPGNTTPGELYAVLLDVAALSQRLKKPLTARLMPIPGKEAGDSTNYDFAFFANSRVMSLRAVSLNGLLAGDENIMLAARK